MSIAAARHEVARSYLTSAAEEMRRTLVRTAFNPVIYEVLDFGISIYDENLDLIADAPGLALFIGANDFAIRRGVEHLDASKLRQGDIVLMNYPYWNSAHAMDVTLFSPVFAPGEAAPFAFTCIRAHWMDLGAKDPGYVLDSTDVQQEGLLMPCLKVYKGGIPDNEIFDLIRFNSRMPDLVIGDLEAQVAATRVGTRRLQSIYAKFGRTSFRSAVEAVLSHGEQMTRERLAALPRGSWCAEDWVDDDGISDDPVLMRVRLRLDGERMSCDFTGSSGAVRGPINMPFGLTEAVCKFVLKSITTPLTPCNAGQFRPLEVTAPPGSLFHAIPPSPTFTLWTAHLALELLYKALAQGMPELMAASSGGDVPGFMMVGHDATGALYAVSNNDPVGWGATSGYDGANATNHLSGCLVRNTPIEVLELRTGMVMESFELLADSGGAGRYRGGLGTRRVIRFVDEGEFLSVAKKTKTAPWGLAGGSDSVATSFTLFPDTERSRRVGTFRAKVAAGDRVSVVTGGGAGYGPRWERAGEAVLADVRDGYVTVDGARRNYGIIITGDAIDMQTSRDRQRVLTESSPAATERLTALRGRDKSITVTSAIPNGSVDVVKAEDPSDVRLRLRRDPGSDQLAIGYYCFMTVGGRGTPWRFTIENVAAEAGARLDGRGEYENAWTGTGPLVSYDRRNWFRVFGHLEGADYVFAHQPERDVCFYARWATYSPDDELGLLARAAAGGATLDSLGATVDSRPLMRIRIGDPGVNKRICWIVARQHPSEMMASYFVDAVVDRLLDPQDPVSRKLLQGASFHIVPNMNPDGAIRGHTRANATGANLNREWLEPSLASSPEVVHVRKEMERTGVDFFLDCHGDEELRCVFLGGPLEIPSRSPKLAALFRAFELSWSAASPDYELGHPYPGGPPAKADLRMAWNWVGEEYRCLSVLMEQPFKDTSWAQDPKTGWSPQRAYRLGQSFPTALLGVLSSLRPDG